MTESRKPAGSPPDIRTDIAHPSRVYDYWLVGLLHEWLADADDRPAICHATPVTVDRFVIGWPISEVDLRDGQPNRVTIRRRAEMNTNLEMHRRSLVLLSLASPGQRPIAAPTQMRWDSTHPPGIPPDRSRVLHEGGCVTTETAADTVRRAAWPPMPHRLCSARWALQSTTAKSATWAVRCLPTPPPCTLRTSRASSRLPCRFASRVRRGPPMRAASRSPGRLRR